MSKLVNLTATTLGSDVSTVSIYHTSVTASNLISSSISKNLLTGSGINFEVADNITTFFAYADSGSCLGFSGSVTASVYSPNTRYLSFLTSGSVDEGASLDMTSPFTIGPTTSSFSSSVNFLTYASATVDANSGTYPQDTFQGWYYSATSSNAFFTGSTLTLTKTTFTGSDAIYAYFKDIIASATITSLAFSDSSITNASQTINFVVTGTEGAQYTLTGATGATAPSGTHTIPAGGTNTHSITIAENGTGTSARSPRVTVATVSSITATVFSPVSLQVYDTVSQAAGPAASVPKAATFSGTQTGPTGTYSAGATLTWSISGTSTVTSGTGANEHADVHGLFGYSPGGGWTRPSPNPNTSTSTWSATETSVGPTTPGTYSWSMYVYHNSSAQTNGITTGTFTVS